MDNLVHKLNATSVRAADAVEAKIDYFFRRHVLPILDPSRIRWWFSLSGGKDSFAMSLGVRRWYERMGVQCTASNFIIDQWGSSAGNSLEQQLQWPSELSVVDGRALTQELTHYSVGQQAPCRSCSDARHDLTDELLARSRTSGKDFTDVVARGLHLTDTAVSLLWRHALGRKGAEEMIGAGKGMPLVQLANGHYLAKPLTYVREFESAAYADAYGYKPACCGCPACRFPSRRDLVEESLCKFIESPLWELDVPGMKEFLAHIGAGADVARLSVCGLHSKHGHLPHAFETFAVERFRRRAVESIPIWSTQCDSSIDLDSIGAAYLKDGEVSEFSDRVPMPALLRGRPLDDPERWMVATMGPFWGAIGLPPGLSSQAWKLQESCFAFSIDERWSQVNGLLHEFYGQQVKPSVEYIISLNGPIRRRGTTSHAIQ
jgi:tRNA(Ile)-lysidine synthase TilS/MesJ